MKLLISEIVVDDRIRQSLGDIDALATDMRVNGQIVPITVRIADDGRYHLVAGFRRMKAMEMNGETEIESYVIVEDDAEALLLKEISENEIRETFTRTERMNYIRQLDEFESKRAKERMAKGTENSPYVGESRNAVAEKVGISSNTIAREKKIIEHKDDIDPEDFKNWDEGKLSTNKVFTELKAKLKAAEDALKQKPKEVIPEDYDNLKQAVKELEANNSKLWKEQQEMAAEHMKADSDMAEKYNKMLAEKNKWEKLYKESGNIEPTMDEQARRDIDSLTMAIYTFLHDYGSNGWSIDRTNISKYYSEALDAQATNLKAFADNLYELVKGAKHE